MPRDFFPRRESDVLAWTNNFREKIFVAPQTYGLTEEQARHYSDTQTAFAAAYRAAITPGTRTSPAVQAKNTLLRTLEDESRRLARIIRAHPATTNDMKAVLGLAIRSKRRKRVPAPASAPQLFVESVVGTTVNMRLLNAEALGRARPRNTLGATVLYFVGDSPPTATSQWSFLLHTSSTRMRKSFGLPAGTKVWFAAFWNGTRQRRGPTSRPVCTNICSGGPAKFAAALGHSLRLADHAPRELKKAA
jgi:hypothetical protein